MPLHHPSDAILHILLISRCPPYPLHLGDRLIVWHLVRELIKLGHTFDLIALTQRPDDVQEQHHYTHLFRTITLIPETPRTITQYLRRLTNSANYFPRSAEQAWSPELWTSVTTHLQATSYDGVHVFGGIQVYEIIRAVRALSPIITPYESFALYMSRQFKQDRSAINRVKEWAARTYERRIYDLYKQVIVLAEPDAQMLRQLSPGLTVRVIPNGIDLEYFTGERPNVVPNSLLFVGNYEYPPNVEAALLLIDKIFPVVRAAVPDATLSIVGNGPPDTLKDRAGEGIVITGRVDDIREAYAQAAVFVSPLITGAGIKNKILEALAMRVPVVATPLSMDGIRVQHGHDALISSVDQMAETIIRLLQNETLQRDLGQAGRALIESEYSWQTVGAEYETLYRNVFRTS